MRYVLARFLILTMMCASFPALIFAQAGGATAEIKGSITDPQKAVVAGATITATAADKGISRSAISDERGEYRLLSLPPGIYQLKIEAHGFVTQTFGNLQVTVGQIAEHDFTLQIGAVTETVEITSSTPVVETERTQQSNTINEQAIRNLPINRRDYLTFTLLAPGVADSNALADNSDFRVKQT